MYCMMSPFCLNADLFDDPPNFPSRYTHNNLVYIDKKRSLDWERECQVQFLAQVLPEQGFLNILTKERLVNFVNANEKTFIDKKQNHKAINHSDEFNESHEINSGAAGKEQIMGNEMKKNEKPAAEIKAAEAAEVKV